VSNWKLPEGIDDLTGIEAKKFEYNRRKLLDLYIDKGFELVIPPMVEYIELLLPSNSIDEKTFKLTDYKDGKTLGIRSDITLQISRIDAKRASNDIEKYCYIGTILQTKADDFYTSRSPIQAGVELYGCKDISTDIEIIKLMLESLRVLSIDNIVLSIGNIEIFNTLIEDQNLSTENKIKLKKIFAKHSVPDLINFLDNNNINNADKLLSLMQLEGDQDILPKAIKIFKDIPKAILAIEDLIKISQNLKKTNIDLIIDFAEFKPYEYHTGIVFSAYNKNYPKALAQGGRYNSINKKRSATGFSFDLKFLSHTNNN
jgi:ATP phosphoribosyltransferase regulatory subunit